MIAYECPNCGSSISVDDDHAGRSAWCRKCRRVSTVPRAEKNGGSSKPVPGSVAITESVLRLDSATPSGSTNLEKSITQPISGLAGPPHEWHLRAPTEPIDLKHIQPAAREEVRTQVSHAANEVERLTKQRSEAVRLLQESASEISRLIGELAAAREESQSLRVALDAHDDDAETKGNATRALREQIDALQQKLVDRDAELNKVSRELADTREQVAATSAQSASPEPDLEGRRALAEAMARDLDGALVCIAERDQEIARIRAALEDAHAQLAAMATAHASASDRPESLEYEQRIADLLEHERIARDEADHLRRALGERDAEFQATYYELAALRKSAEERDRLAHDYAEISQTLVDSRRRLKEEENKRTALESELGLVRTQLAEMESEFQRMRYELTVRETSTETGEAEAQPALSMPEVERDEFNQQIEALKAQTAAATQRAWSLHEALQRASAISKERESAVESLQAQLSELRLSQAAYDDLQRQLDEMRAARDQAEAALTAREETIAVMQLEANQWKSRLDERGGDIQHVTFERDLAVQQRDTISKEIEAERVRLREALAEVDAARSEVESLRATVQERDCAIREIQAEHATLRTRDEERSSELQVLSERLEAASRHAESTSSLFDSETAKWQALTASHDETKTELASARAELETREEQIRAFQESAARVETSLRETQLASEELKRELDLSKATVQEKEDRIDDLDFQVAGLSATLRERDEAAVLAEKQSAALKSQVDAISQELEDVRATLIAAQAQLGPADVELSNLRESTSRLAAREKDLRTALEHRTSEVERLLADISEFRAREKALTTDLQSRAGEIAALRARVDENAAAHARAEETHRQLEQAKSEALTERDRFTTEMAELRARLAAQEEEAEQVRRNFELAQRNNSESVTRIASLEEQIEAARAQLSRLTQESEALRENAELYRQSSNEYEREVGALRAELERSRSENEALQMTAKEAQKLASRADIEMASLRAELERQSAEQVRYEAISVDSQAATAAFQAELDALRAELAGANESKRAVELSLEQALENSRRTNAELSAAKARIEELTQESHAVLARLEEDHHGANEHSNEAESLRARIAGLEREIAEYKSQRETESRSLSAQLEQAAAEISKSAQEIERLNADLNDARKLASSSMGALDDAARLQHALGAHHDELWREAPAGEGNVASVTPVVMGSEEEDEQKVLVDALLRFLGRR